MIRCEDSSINPDDFVLYFENVKQDKNKIYNKLRDKSGVYLFINNITKDLYVVLLYLKELLVFFILQILISLQK